MSQNLGVNIRTYRKQKGFTQEELAHLLGVTPQAVSRWESEAGLPDIGLIIPMAQILGVTTDALFGYDKVNQDEVLTKRVIAYAKSLHDKEDRWGSALKVCDYLCEESAKNPTNYEIQVEFVQWVAHLSMLVDLEGFLKDEPARYQKMYDEGIRKGIQVIRYSNDHELLDKAHYAMAWIYIHMKDFDNAREHVNILPSLSSNRMREAINMELTFFEKGFEEMKDVIAENTKLLYSVIGKQLQAICENYAFFDNKEEALRVCDWSDRVVCAYGEKQDYIQSATYYNTRKTITFYKMLAYFRAGEKEKANQVYEEFLAEMKERKDLSQEDYEGIVSYLDHQVKINFH